MRKCNREINTWHQGWYYYKGRYFCQSCDGILIDKDYIKKIIDYNTPVNLPKRDEQIEKELNVATKHITQQPLCGSPEGSPKPPTAASHSVGRYTQLSRRAKLYVRKKI